MKQLIGLLVGGTALAVAVGCSTDPALYLGGPAGPTAALAVSNSRADLRVGGTATVGARGVDAVGNTTADVPNLASCDGSVVSVGTAT
ncbi:MAG: hypothetical protein OEW06_14780, partial [Gemmatimonadota bacterium]|nr:hypothetical protein [Gemmatimonadota bacterium]